MTARWPTSFRGMLTQAAIWSFLVLSTFSYLRITSGIQTRSRYMYFEITQHNFSLCFSAFVLLSIFRLSYRGSVVERTFIKVPYSFEHSGTIWDTSDEFFAFSATTRFFLSNSAHKEIRRFTSLHLFDNLSHRFNVVLQNIINKTECKLCQGPAIPFN